MPLTNSIFLHFLHFHLISTFLTFGYLLYLGLSPKSVTGRLLCFDVSSIAKQISLITSSRWDRPVYGCARFREFTAMAMLGLEAPWGRWKVPMRFVRTGSGSQGSPTTPAGSRAAGGYQSSPSPEHWAHPWRWGQTKNRSGHGTASRGSGSWLGKAMATTWQVWELSWALSTGASA